MQKGPCSPQIITGQKRLPSKLKLLHLLAGLLHFGEPERAEEHNPGSVTQGCALARSERRLALTRDHEQAREEPTGTARPIDAQRFGEGREAVHRSQYEQVKSAGTCHVSSELTQGGKPQQTNWTKLESWGTRLEPWREGENLRGASL